MNTTPTVIISLSPTMRGNIGHDFNYHQSVSIAASSIGWEQRVAIPTNCQLENIPVNWNKCLKVDHSTHSVFILDYLFKITRMPSYAVSVYSYLKEQLSLYPTNQKIIFLESFSLGRHLIPFVLSIIFIPRQSFSVWLLYRYNTKQLRPHEGLHKIMYKVFKLLFKSRVHLLTDSELLKKSLSTVFNSDVHLMPIPHTHFFATQIVPSPKPEEPIILWWPGEPRLDKGLAVIKNLISLPCTEANIQLVVSKEADLDTTSSQINLIKIEGVLSPSEYSKWLLTSDIILLPYDQERYSEPSSGIFVECIIAGKMPLVTENTWMAYELEKHNLKELAISWDKPNFIPWALKRLKDEHLKTKLTNMQKKYAAYHNEQSFASAMKTLNNHSRANPEGVECE